jgi:periplasmic protein TonB
MFILLAQLVSGAAGQPAPIQFKSDYPREALKQGWQGDVGADLVVNTKGRVSTCTIYQSSGHSVLDQATCELFRKRARFRPATDANGSPIEGRVHADLIKWRIGR